MRDELIATICFKYVQVVPLVRITRSNNIVALIIRCFGAAFVVASVLLPSAETMMCTKRANYSINEVEIASLASLFTNGILVL